MNSLKVKAPAKLNLTLDIGKKRDDGYHLMDMVMQTIDLYDVIRISKTDDDFVKVSSTDEKIPLGDENTAHRAAINFIKTVEPQHRGFKIEIQKNIPSQAGLGGASSDAAGVLVGLNALCGTGLSLNELCDIGITVGADVPFCIVGSTAHITGIGENIVVLPDLPECFFLVVKPPFGMLTKHAFELYDDYSAEIKRPDTDSVISAIDRKDVDFIAKSLCNVFEPVVFPDKILPIKNALIAAGALGAGITGSGVAVFGIFRSETEAQNAIPELVRFGKVFLASPVRSGAVVY
ncbi:MAG: 4-(cytidine 5'-diphospho)-2-C-methyl-D-erythritol kinase [Oscillospiraceae bacterium]|nr:4-(cytidine 5'-diphospho)-2-C-methyl-D-erythritol kinase [Oscillospiraceae bacterium]